MRFAAIKKYIFWFIFAFAMGSLWFIIEKHVFSKVFVTNKIWLDYWIISGVMYFIILPGVLKKQKKYGFDGGKKVRNSIILSIILIAIWSITAYLYVKKYIDIPTGAIDIMFTIAVQWLFAVYIYKYLMFPLMSLSGRARTGSNNKSVNGKND